MTESREISEIRFANIIQELPLLYEKIKTKIENKYQIIIDGVLGSEFDLECQGNWESKSSEARTEKRRLQKHFGKIEKKIRSNQMQKKRLCQKGCCTDHIKYSHELTTDIFLSSTKYPTILASLKLEK